LVLDVSHFDHNDIIGAWFQIGDISTGSGLAADPLNCRTLDKIRVLDFGGMGSYDIGDMFTVRFDVWCADEQGCPIGPSLWNSGPVEFYEAGWNYIQVNPPISICSCAGVPGPTGSSPRVLVTATATGSDPWYPAWGTDNISTPVSTGCLMHDTSCLPALYPRPTSSNYSSLHSGYYGNGGFQYCPAQGFRDGADTSQDGSVYGCVELAWRIYVDCTGPSSVQPVTWGAIKSMYK